MLPGSFPMSMGPKPSTRRASSGPNQGGTPDTTRPIPTHSDLKSLTVHSGPIKSVHDARKWLETKGWILAAEPYNRAKLVSILATAAIASKLDDLKRAALAIAFILDADISNHVSDTLTEAVASKVLGRLEGTTDKLSSTAAFLVANDANRAGLTLDLKAATDKLVGVTASLEARSSGSMCPPPPQPTDTPITWASIAKAAPKTTQPASAPRGPVDHSLSQSEITQIQQRVLCDARTVLIQCNTDDPLIQKASTALL
ncbi:hypothetical protein C0992_003050 [Termitomyces sp. T32_za158]|nr:hypothetical protein C0992_003050 [Termitomyces sp. T32_za158]